mmetsp:Transcript_39363/g.84287  ORF Transcript_39363/g.84287 Transcript_39363/m.84287 type:complete len:86 (+) Transcript_39363:539-796(+)
MKDRFLSDGASDLQDILKRWKPWLPPKQIQGLQQGGLVCFDGTRKAFFHRDESTGAHADFAKALETLATSAESLKAESVKADTDT